jgi:hypothetical protein
LKKIHSYTPVCKAEAETHAVDVPELLLGSYPAFNQVSAAFIPPHRVVSFPVDGSPPPIDVSFSQSSVASDASTSSSMNLNNDGVDADVKSGLDEETEEIGTQPIDKVFSSAFDC